MVNAMLWILRTGAPWRDMPGHYPPWRSVYTRFSRWSKQGVWQRVLVALAEDANTEGYQLDSSSVRAHQDAHGAQKGGASYRAFARGCHHLSMVLFAAVLICSR